MDLVLYFLYKFHILSVVQTVVISLVVIGVFLYVLRRM